MTIETPPIVPTSAPSAHPLILSPEIRALGEDNAVVTTVASALSKVYTTLSAMTVAHKAAHAEADVKNAALMQMARRAGTTPPGQYMNKAGNLVMPMDATQAMALNAAVKDAFEHACKPALAGAMEIVDRRSVALRTALDEAVIDKLAHTGPGLHYVDKIHALLQNMKAPGERSSWVQAKIKEGNVRAVAAVVNSEPEFSGIDPKMIAVLRDHAQKTFAPKEFDELKHVRNIATKLTTATEVAARHMFSKVVEVRQLQNASLQSLNALRDLAKTGGA